MNEDTMVVVMSTTKGLSAMTLALANRVPGARREPVDAHATYMPKRLMNVRVTSNAAFERSRRRAYPGDAQGVSGPSPRKPGAVSRWLHP
jgi:hypothetical protein